MLHTGQHYDRELSEVFFEELGLAEPRYRLGLRNCRPRGDGARDPGGGRRPSDPTGYSSSATRTRRSPAPRRPARRRSPTSRRGYGASTSRCPRSGTGSRSTGLADAAASAPTSARRRSSGSREPVAGRVVVGDVMADAHRLFAPIARAPVATCSDGSGSRPAATCSSRSTARRTSGRSGSRASSPGSTASSEPIVFPAHPRTRAALARARAARHSSRSTPLGYLDFAALVAQAPRRSSPTRAASRRRRTGSGVPCVTMRPSTEWVDTVEAGANVLVDDDPDGDRARRRARRASREAHRSSTATARRAAGSRPLCTLPRREPRPGTSRSSAPATSGCRSPRPSPTRGNACSSSTSCPSSSRRSTSARATSRTSPPSALARPRRGGQDHRDARLRGAEAGRARS